MSMPTWTRGARGSVEAWGAGVGPPPGWSGPVIPPERLPGVMVRTYEGAAHTVRARFRADAAAMAARGYRPTSEAVVPLIRPPRDWGIALALVLVGIGILLLAYYLAVPLQALSVTYARLDTAADDGSGPTRSALASLDRMRADGTISREEYEAKRREILARL